MFITAAALSALFSSLLPRRMPRWLPLLLVCLLGLALTGCATVIPTADDVSTADAFGTWACDASSEVVDFILVIALFFGIIGAVLWGMGKFAPSFFSFATNLVNNYGQNIITGALILVIGPVVIKAIFSAIGGPACG